MSETRKYIETTASGGIVSVDIERSHAATHLREQPGLWELTQEVLRKTKVVTPPGEDAVFETDMSRVVGEMDLVDVKPSDWEGPEETRIRWAKRLNRATWTPFVVRDKRPTTRFVVVVLKHLEIAQLDPATLDPKLLDPEIAIGTTMTSTPLTLAEKHHPCRETPTKQKKVSLTG
jgi:hypothetical protein